MIESVERLLEEDTFSVYVPSGFEIIEKGGQSEAELEESRPIGGFCSTENLDRQDEVVVAKGLDFTEFVSWGYFNDNHKQDTSAILGYPRVAKLHGDRWYTEGNIIKGYPPADKVWDLAKALRKSNAPRRLGFSIEGKVLERNEGNKIVRAKVRNVAITNCPVNTDCTWDILAKAFASGSEVVDAQKKALVASHGMSQNGGGNALRSQDTEVFRKVKDLSFKDAIERLQKMRPHLSKAACERIVRFAMR